MQRDHHDYLGRRHVTTMADAALRYAERGWRVFPCVPRTKRPPIAGGFHSASDNPEQVADWWRRWPQANIGHCPADSGHVVIDVDGPGGERAAQALGLLSEPTLEVASGREDGGHHRWYRHPGGIISNKPLALHLDVRGDNGLVVLPPSVHRTGRVYAWRGRLADVIDLPPAVVARLRELARGTNVPTQPPSPGGLRLAVGERNDGLASLAGTLRRRGLSVAQMLPSMLEVNANAEEPLPRAEVEGIAYSVARYDPHAAPTSPAASPPARRVPLATAHRGPITPIRPVA